MYKHYSFLLNLKIQKEAACMNKQYDVILKQAVRLFSLIHHVRMMLCCECRLDDNFW